jgi:hypothetical protein
MEGPSLILWINARSSNPIFHFRWKPDGASQITITAFGCVLDEDDLVHYSVKHELFRRLI